MNIADVLIVDDDQGMTETMSDILEALGFNVEVANDGLEGLEKVQAQHFHVIFMDIKMQGLNGVDTLKKMKHITPKVVVMMMTAYSVEDLVAEAKKEGAYGVMYKPINIENVIVFIRKVMERPNTSKLL